MRRLPQRAPIAHVSRDRWLVSYADFMTLLFAFFATMYGISSVDAQKLQKVAQAMQTVFDDAARGVFFGGGSFEASSFLASNAVRMESTMSLSF